MATTYSGDPTKFPEAVTLYDDSVPPTGSNINRAPQANLDRTAYLRAKFDTVAAANFHDPSSGTSFGLTGSINNIGGFGYDPRSARGRPLSRRTTAATIRSRSSRP